MWGVLFFKEVNSLRETSAYYVFSPEDIQKTLPYDLIARVRQSAAWDSEKRKKIWGNWIGVLERDRAYIVLKKAAIWSAFGPPERDIRISPNMVATWRKVALICAMIQRKKSEVRLISPYLKEEVLRPVR